MFFGAALARAGVRGCRIVIGSLAWECVFAALIVHPLL